MSGVNQQSRASDFPTSNPVSRNQPELPEPAEALGLPSSDEQSKPESTQLPPRQPSEIRLKELQPKVGKVPNEDEVVDRLKGRLDQTVHLSVARLRSRLRREVIHKLRMISTRMDAKMDDDFGETIRLRIRFAVGELKSKIDTVQDAFII
jgi:hypothetical protein